jgi:hypothetical protein
MKQTILLLLTLALLLSACGTTAPVTTPETTSVPTVEPTAEPTPEPTSEPASAPLPTEVPVTVTTDPAGILALLRETDERAEPGSAGAALKAASVACDFLDYFMSTSISRGEVRTAAESFLAGLTAEEKAAFAAKLATVENARRTFTESTSYAEGLLRDCGRINDCFYPWDEAAHNNFSGLIDAFGGRAAFEALLPR